MGHGAARFYGVDVCALPAFAPYMLRYFDYATKLDMWADVFGRDALTVRRFQTGDLVDGDVVADFAYQAGLPSLQSHRINTSWTRSQLLAGLQLQKDGYQSGAFVPLLRETEMDGPLLPSRAEAAAFLAACAASNQRLAQAFDTDGPAAYFNDDMSKYPETANDDPDVLSFDLGALRAALPAPLDLAATPGPET